MLGLIWWCELLWLATAAVSDTDHKPLIRKGTLVTDPRQYPFVVALMQSTGLETDRKEKPWSYCGGAILDQNFIITAGHCVLNFEFPVYVGQTNLTLIESEYLFWPIALHRHPNYGKIDGNSFNDVGLIRLSRAINLATVAPIELISDQRHIDPNRCVTLGWGLEGPKEQKTNMLREIDMIILDEKQCQKDIIGHFNPDIMLCAQPKQLAPAGPCSGDSGSPLICREKNYLTRRHLLVGVVSFGDISPCQSNQTKPPILVVFTRLANGSFRRWIEHVMGSEESSAPTYLFLVASLFFLLGVALTAALVVVMRLRSQPKRNRITVSTRG